MPPPMPPNRKFRVRRASVDRYRALISINPALFVNPPGAAFAILLDDQERARAESAAADRLRSRGQPPAWARTGIVFEDQYLTILRDAVGYLDGSVGTYIRLVDLGGPVGVAVLPRRGHEILLIEHFRHSTRRWHWEIPRGFGATGESPAETGERELLEETGLRPERMRPLGAVYPDTGLGDGQVALFLAEVKGNPHVESNEGVRSCRFLDLHTVEAHIVAGEIDDGFTLAAFAQARARRWL